MKNIVAFGNPLLDTIVSIKDNSLLQKYNLEVDGQKEISLDEMKSLKKDISEYAKTVTAGGCGQNTLKVMQWLTSKQFSATMFGAVGNDSEAELLRGILEEHGVKTRYVTHNNHLTGSTVSLVSGENRSLVAHLGAAEVLTLEHVTNIANIVENADLIYMEGFFLTKRTDVAVSILNTSKCKEFAFNLSGEYLCREYPDIVKYFMEKSSIIFGNKREFDAMCPIMGESDAQNLVTSLGKSGKLVVMTEGPGSVICEAGGGRFCRIEVPVMKKEEIVDTTGAGDSFVAGFLTGHLLKQELEACLRLGCYAAQEIIKTRGCIVPDSPPNSFT